MSPLLNNGITRTIFVPSGKIPFYNKVLNICCRGLLDVNYFYLNTYQYHHDLFTFVVLFTRLKTLSSVTDFLNNVFSTLSYKYPVNTSLLVGILFARDGPIFT